MTPSEPPKPGDMPPPFPVAAVPPTPPAGDGVARYYLFQGPLVDDKTKADEARACARDYIGWATYLCCSDNLNVMLDFVKEAVDEDECWWQIVDIQCRLIVYSSHDPRPRH